MTFSFSIRMQLACTAAVLLAAPLAALAQEAPTTRPALDELNREIHALYDQARGGLLPMQLPPPQWASDYALEPINKYQQIDPALRQRIAQQMQQNTQTFAHIGSNGSYIVTSRVYSNSNGANDPAAPTTQGSIPQGSTTQPTIIVVQPNGPMQGPQNTPGGQLELPNHGGGDFAPTHVGVVLDQQGDVLVPLCLERETCEAQPVRLTSANGQIIEAKFIGSDRQTNLSVVNVGGVGGKSLQLGDRPDVGSVCMFISPVDGSARLGVWTGGPRDWGYVLSIDGRLAGIARAGQLISGSSCKVIADEILQHGSVRRPTLGVVVRELIQVDPQIGQKSVMRVEAVLAGSPADQAGIKPGDILQSLRGKPITDVTTLSASMAACSGPTEVHVLRADQDVTLTAQLELPSQK